MLIFLYLILFLPLLRLLFQTIIISSVHEFFFFKLFDQLIKKKIKYNHNILPFGTVQQYDPSVFKFLIRSGLRQPSNGLKNTVQAHNPLKPSDPHCICTNAHIIKQRPQQYCIFTIQLILSQGRHSNVCGYNDLCGILYCTYYVLFQVIRKYRT